MELTTHGLGWDREEVGQLDLPPHGLPNNLVNFNNLKVFLFVNGFISHPVSVIEGDSHPDLSLFNLGYLTFDKPITCHGFAYLNVHE